MNEVCEFIRQCGEYFLATVDGDQPRVRPFSTAVVFEDRLYIQTEKFKNVAKQMLANPKVEMCAYDKVNGGWVRVEATVVPDERVEAKQFVLDQYPELKSKYTIADTIVFYLKDAKATFYSSVDKSRTVLFN